GRGTPGSRGGKRACRSLPAPARPLKTQGVPATRTADFSRRRITMKWPQPFRGNQPMVGVFMRTFTYSLIVLVLLATLGFAEEPKEAKVLLFDGLGKHSRKIDTRNAMAQQHFDQGMMFMFAYNHDEAVRSFRRAANLDPESAMPYWGIALA